MYDYIVIGAGINGSWSALHLAKRGHKVLLLEQVKFLVHLDSINLSKFLLFSLVSITPFKRKLPWTKVCFSNFSPNFCREIRLENCICSRGIRKAYSEAFQTEMMNDAYKQWYQLEKDYGERLLK